MPRRNNRALVFIAPLDRTEILDGPASEVNTDDAGDPGEHAGR